MSDSFDIGPLTWVKDDINQSLDSVLESVETLSTNPAETSGLRFSQTHLYQASGALDMVGLEGCKLFCSYLEKLAVKLERKELEVTTETIDHFVKAIKQLKFYVQELLNGSADIPLRLYPVMKPIAEAVEEPVNESQLFFPDTSNNVPKGVESQEFSEEAYIAFIAEQRSQYQKSLLKWMQSKNEEALEGIVKALSAVTSAQHKPSVKTLWWVASGFAETLALPAIADNTAAKKLCRKLDQELKQLTEGESKPNPDLLRDLLYFVAVSDIDNALVLEIKKVFELSGLVDNEQTKRAEQLPSSEAELAAVEQLSSVLKDLREIWEEVSVNIDFEAIDASEMHALVEIDNVLITKFVDKLGSADEPNQALRQTAVSDLITALSKASEVLRDDKTKVSQAALIEVATALHLLDTALAHYQTLDADTIQGLTSEAERITAIEEGLEDAIFEDRRVGGLDRDTIDAVVKDINASLKVVEQSLDTYFRNPNDRTPLSLTPTPLKQMSAIFDMLNLATPMQIVNASDRYIHYFQKDDYNENQADFELLAESLSMVGLFANEIPNVRPESTAALEGALERLNAALEQADIEFIEEVEAANVDVTEPKDMAKEPTSKLAEAHVDKAFDEELSDIYITEAEEVLAHVAQGLQALRVNPTDQEALVEVRRNYHTLKGSGRTVGLVVQGEVAAKVEIFLNGILDKNATLNAQQIEKLEKITGTFAGWATELKENNEVSINQAQWIDEAEALSHIKPDTEKAVDAADVGKPEGAYVLIGGKRKLGKKLYEIFLNESMQNLSILEQDVVKLTEEKRQKPAKQAKHAAHTLGSNALAAGFKPMGDLTRALEGWFDAVTDSWSPEHLTLYGNVTKAIARMWQAASELKTPRAARALIKLLEEATEKATHTKEVHDVMDALIDNESVEDEVIAEVAEEAISTIELDDVNETEAEDAFDVDDVEELDGSKLGVLDSVELQSFTEVVNDENRQHINPELLDLFVEEANAIIPTVGDDLRSWQAAPKDKAYSESLARSLHTLKGSARMAGLSDIGNIAHELEEFILQKKKNTPQADDFESMFIALDKMAAFFDKAEDQPAQQDAILGTVGDTNAVDEDEAPAGRGNDRKSQFLRLRADVLDRLINEAGEISIIRSRVEREMGEFKDSSNDLSDSLVRLRGYLRELEIEAETQMQSRMSILQEANETFDPLEFDRFTRLQELTRMIAESVNDVDTVQSTLLNNLSNTEIALQEQGLMNRDLQQGLLGARMLPLQQITERMQRIVRQTARELKKSANLVIHGESTEIDRSILDRISAPIEHLLRNAVAHGIESKADRKSAGKAAKGLVQMKVATINDEIHIEIVDDGAGVDLEKVKQKAIDKGLLTKKSKPTEDTLLSVIFEPGFSTASDVSQIAGRGVGLDVVRNDISSLGGRVDMTTEAGKGTKFDIFLPVTQSVAQILAVRAGEEVYALPVAMIVQAQKIKRDHLLEAYAEGKVKWDEVSYPLHHLAKMLDHQEHQIEDAPYASVILLRSGTRIVALHVDEVIGNQEVVMKAIGPELARVPGIVGATVSGDGEIVLILNPVQIANREALSAGSVSVKRVKTKAKKVAKKLRALVVDDSLTMRKVLSRLLERDGYEVTVAKDGMDAMEQLQISTPDIVLTDIEMPRMDGFGLSRNIRDDERTKSTPLIVISSRTADKHQDLAKEIGVDAYFGKPVPDEELLAEMKALLKAHKKK